jgi:hypothetical protein
VKHRDKPKESALEMSGAALAAFLAVFALVWFVASNRIVYYTADVFRWMAWPYSLFDPAHWQALNEAAAVYRQRPRDVGLVLWMRYTNACMFPSAVVFSLLCAVYVVVRLASPKGREFKRRLGPMALASEIAKEFPNILPVLHLGKDLVADKLPLWKRQTFPEEIWLHEKVAGRPIESNGRLDLQAVETYFRGGERRDGPHQMRGDRRWSKTLGYQVVHLLDDAPRQQSICFPDRFSSAGKVLFALLAAHAFGGRTGKADYQKACAQINHSCAGQPNGLPNLTVAQWLYSKYRMNPHARQLFAAHHWEYSYLYALFRLAKKNGKATHTDWIWLKPLDRIMFYALNTVGRATPHAESAPVFVMHDYETKCVLNKRLPLRIRPDGAIEHHIHVLPAVEGLAQEFERWTSARDEDNDWWRDKSAWTGAQALAQQRKELAEFTQEAMAQMQSITLKDAGPAILTPFEMASKAKAEQEELASKAASLERLRDAFQEPVKKKAASADDADGALNFLD